MGFILMYDITNEESFNSVQDWWEQNIRFSFHQFFKRCINDCLSRVTQIKTYSWDNAQVILVGNKCDMEDERVISFERGKQLADQLGVEFFETSAKENINVKVRNLQRHWKLQVWPRYAWKLWITKKLPEQQVETFSTSKSRNLLFKFLLTNLIISLNNKSLPAFNFPREFLTPLMS